MSSLRRRAICTQRARSIARSSTGGRASARTTAPASPGSTSSRSQASTSLTSARSKQRRRAGEAVGDGALVERGCDRLALLAHRAHEHGDLAGVGAAAHEPLDLGGRGLRLRALARAAPEGAPHRRPVRSRAGRCGRGSARRPRARRRGSACGVRSDSLEPQRRRASGSSAAMSRRFFAAAPRARVDRLVRVPGGRQPAVLGAQREHEPQVREREVLRVVDEHVAIARRRPARARAGARAARSDSSTRSPASSAPCSRSIRSWAR